MYLHVQYFMLNYSYEFRLWVETVNVLQPANQNTDPTYTHQNIIEDLLIILRYDICVIRYVGETDFCKLKYLLFHS